MVAEVEVVGDETEMYRSDLQKHLSLTYLNFYFSLNYLIC